MKNVLIVMAALVSSNLFAHDSMMGGGFTDKGLMALAAAIAMSVAAFGGALGQGKAASAALEGIARNPSASNKIFTPMIIALALIESLVIYAFVIAFLIRG